MEFIGNDKFGRDFVCVIKMLKFKLRNFSKIGDTFRGVFVGIRVDFEKQGRIVGFEMNRRNFVPFKAYLKPLSYYSGPLHHSIDQKALNQPHTNLKRNFFSIFLMLPMNCLYATLSLFEINR